MYRIHFQPYLQQVKTLNHLYGAAFDHRHMRTATPTLTKWMPIIRQTNDETWQKTDLARVHNFSQLADIFTAASAVVDITVDGAVRRRGRRRRHSKRSVGSGRSRPRLPVVENVSLDGTDCFHHKQRDGAGICEECGGPLHLPRAPKEKEKVVEKAPARKAPSIGAETIGKPDLNIPQSMYNWDDPRAPWNRGFEPSHEKTRT